MLWGVISLAMVIVFNLFSQPQHSSQPSVTYSEFLRQAAKGEVSEVVIQGNTLTGKTTDGKSFQIYVPDDPGLVDKLTGAHPSTGRAPSSPSSMIPQLAPSIAWGETFSHAAPPCRRIRGRGSSIPTVEALPPLGSEPSQPPTCPGSRRRRPSKSLAQKRREARASQTGTPV